MKKKIFLGAAALALCALLFSFRLNEVTMYSFASINPETGKIKAKLQPNTALKQRPKGKTTAVTYQIEGVKSSVRLRFEDNMFDVMSDMQSQHLNPILYIGFYKLTSGRQGRTLVIDPTSGDNVIGFNLSQLDQSTWRLLVGGALMAGEYAFIDKTSATTEGHLTVWTFGID